MFNKFFIILFEEILFLNAFVDLNKFGNDVLFVLDIFSIFKFISFLFLSILFLILVINISLSLLEPKLYFFFSFDNNIYLSKGDLVL